MRYFALLMIIFLAACSAQQTISTVPATNTSVPALSNTAAASLALFIGDVTVNSAPAVQGMELKEGDTLKTGKGSQATLVLYDSSVVRLRADTELVLSRLSSEKTRFVQLKQLAGETWTRVLRISGITQYEIVTPNTVATVRGTGFKVDVSAGKTRVGVGEGSVHVAKLQDNLIVAETDVDANKQAEIVDTEFAISDATEAIQVGPLDDEWVDVNLAADESFIDEQTAAFAQEHSDLLGQLNSSDPEKADALARGIVTGNLSSEDRALIGQEHLDKLLNEGIDLVPDGEPAPAKHDESELNETPEEAAEGVESQDHARYEQPDNNESSQKEPARSPENDSAVPSLDEQNVPALVDITEPVLDEDNTTDRKEHVQPSLM